ncbi:hypothetical protein [Hydrogenothermus marinus]|uniref:Uncharacterized protein n=1 Tax=Hydrogenothermus marinus TaxID=133270 RepID=A0A3M0BDM4_9AQUI|nr:hypothetical protein [Hydrogenothermus marinus]RMA93068.1 hypothetical protein CLV39_1548 [Hydrogenothermus marinus]
MEEHIYQPFDVRMAEDGEIIAIVEPESYLKQMIENEETCWEMEVDVDYDNETDEAYLMIFLHKDNGQIFIALPYGEAWDALIDKGVITIALLTQFDLDHGDVSDAITISIEIDEFNKGFIAGASRMWEAVKNI